MIIKYTLILLLIYPLIACSYQGTNREVNSGIEGRVEWGPTCGNVPVLPEISGTLTLPTTTCKNIPVKTTLTITNTDGTIIAKDSSKDDGTFSVRLPPGEYILATETSEFMIMNPIHFTVLADKFTYIPVIYPSMIP